MYHKPKAKSSEEIEREYKSKKSYFGLPFEVKFCKKCIISNQRPVSEILYKNNIKTQKKTIRIHDDGICDACKFNEKKRKDINWEKREKELIDLCNKHRGNGNDYDCIVPGSGGKDSFFVAHMLKYKYNMTPLTITWAPHMYTETGRKNMENWSNAGFDNYLVTPNRKIQRLLTRLAIDNLFNPFQPFVFGQKFLAPKIALKLGIKLIFYGENAAEYGNDSAEGELPTMNIDYFSTNKIEEDKTFIGGVSIRELKEKFGLKHIDLLNYLPINKDQLTQSDVEVYYFGYFKKWHQQSNYYYAVKHGGFVTNPERMPGTYTKYTSCDDKMEDFNYYTLGIKFGLGWTSNIASFEIRDGDLTREEGVALAKKYDLEFPKRFLEDLFKYLTIGKEEYPIAHKMFEEPEFNYEYFMNLHDRFRSPHLWKKTVNNEWQLRNTVWDDAKKSNTLTDKQELNAMKWEGNLGDKV